MITCFDSSFVHYCTFTICTYKSKFDTPCNYMSFEYYYSFEVFNSYFPFNIQQGHIVRVIWAWVVLLMKNTADTLIASHLMQVWSDDVLKDLEALRLMSKPQHQSVPVSLTWEGAGAWYGLGGWRGGWVERCRETTINNLLPRFLINSTQHHSLQSSNNMKSVLLSVSLPTKRIKIC